MYKIIYDEKQLKEFFDVVLPPLQNTEVYFVSMSARNKYLTEEEKKFYGLGRTEMFERRIVRYRKWDRFLRTIRKFETNKGSYLTKNGINIPQHCIICYININPSDTLKSYKEFNKIMNEYMYELSECSINNRDKQDIINRINKMDTLLMNCYQKNKSKKYWIDIDFDIKKDDYDIVETFLKDLEEEKILYHVIDTHSGYHVLLNRQTITYDFNKSLEKCRDLGYDKYKDTKWEIDKNDNEMIPLPGTIQGNYEVRLLK